MIEIINSVRTKEYARSLRGSFFDGWDFLGFNYCTCLTFSYLVDYKFLETELC